MLYTWEATDKEDAIVHGTLEAPDKANVVEYLQKRNLIPIVIEAPGGEGGSSVLSINLFETVTALDRILLVRNLGASIRAGLSLIESLEILIADSTKRIMQTILSHAKSNLENGQPLSETFKTYKKFFPVIFVAMLRAGEVSGRLDQTLEELVHHLQREYNLNKKIRSALAYPLILVVASVGVIILLLVFVLPRLTKAFKSANAQLPWITRALIVLSNILTYSIIIDLVVVGIVAWFFIFFRKTEKGKHIFLVTGSSIPVVKELLKKVALVRFTRTLGGLVASGIPITEALTLSADSSGNEYYKAAIEHCREEIRNGIPIAQTLRGYPHLFPLFAISLIGVGERTGTLEGVLKNLADFYDDEIESALKDLTTFIEPILLLVMGLVIGAIALSILLPIYRLVGSIQ